MFDVNEQQLRDCYASRSLRERQVMALVVKQTAKDSRHGIIRAEFDRLDDCSDHIGWSDP